MFHDDGRQMTLCGILKRIAENTDDEKIQLMANEATVMAKKMDTKLKMYSAHTRRFTNKITAGEYCRDKCFFL